VWTNLALVIDDPARRSALARERIATVESGKGASHPLVLEARISSAGFESDPRNAREALGPPCDQLADLHREHGYRILGCQYELGWLAVERDDDAAARRAFTRAVASAQTGGRGPRLAVARAQLERLDGRPEPAARQLTAVLDQLGQLDKVAWWELVDAADAMLARGEIARRAGRLAAARADFEAARRALETAIAKSKNDAPRFARRRALAQASLVRASRERPMPPELRGFAAAAIAWYRSAGGYDDVIAELEPVLAP
jgi:tetratricopeptide (TPR) repeat protein